MSDRVDSCSDPLFGSTGGLFCVVERMSIPDLLDLLRDVCDSGKQKSAERASYERSQEWDVLCKTILELVKKGHVHYTDIEKKAAATCLRFATSNITRKQLYPYLQFFGFGHDNFRLYKICFYSERARSTFLFQDPYDPHVFSVKTIIRVFPSYSDGFLQVWVI